MKAWRVFVYGKADPRRVTRAFGIDYPTLERAREVKASYATNFPHLRYFIRVAAKNGWPEPERKAS